MEDLKILQKIYDMLAYGQICLKQFPKHEKHVLASDIRSTMYRMLELTIRANKKYHKNTTLQDLDIEIEVLRTFLRLSLDNHYMNIHKYEVWTKMISEIGKMLGGWMKATT